MALIDRLTPECIENIKNDLKDYPNIYARTFNDLTKCMSLEDIPFSTASTICKANNIKYIDGIYSLINQS